MNLRKKQKAGLLNKKAAAWLLSASKWNRIEYCSVVKIKVQIKWHSLVVICERAGYRMCIEDVH